MKLKDVLSEGRVEIYEFEKSLSSPTLMGCMLYKGDSKFLKEATLNREVVRIFDYVVPTYIVF